jgi:DNA-binding transcriptional MocR family regulator
MPYFSTTVNHIRSSEIRDLMKLATRPDVISFAGGMPNNHLFPVEEVDEIFRNLPLEKKETAFQYGPTSGYPPLLDTLKEYLRKKGLPVDTHKLIVTTGSLQAINILGMEFIDPGDVVFTENPSFIGGLAVFKAFQAKIIGIPLNEDGMDLEILEENLNKFNPKLLYIIPNFHNPAGISYSQQKRKDLLKILKGRDIVLLEDDAYNELFFNEKAKDEITPLMAMNDQDVEIVYTGSFSKILGPGLRLGWMLASPEIYDKAEIIKQGIDACSPNFTQVIADEFIREGYMENYLKKIRKEYAERSRLMLDALKKYMPEGIRWSIPKGGFYIWVEMPEEMDSTEVLKESIKNGAVFVTGKTFDPEGKQNNYFRLSYSNMDKNQIDKGVKIIAEAVRNKWIANQPTL